MSMQRIIRWGHDFPKDKGVGMLTLSQFGENPCVMGKTHQSGQLPFFLSSLPSHLFCHKVVEVVISWKGKSMGKFKLGREPSFVMSCFACMDKKTLESYANLTHAFMFWFYSHVLGSCETFWLIHHLHSPFEWNLLLCVSFAFYKCFSLGETVIDVLHCYLKLQSV